MSKPQPKVLTPASPPVAFTTATAFGGSQAVEESFQGWYPKTFEDRSTESALEAAHAFDGGSVRTGGVRGYPHQEFHHDHTKTKEGFR